MDTVTMILDFITFHIANFLESGAIVMTLVLLPYLMYLSFILLVQMFDKFLARHGRMRANSRIAKLRKKGWNVKLDPDKDDYIEFR